MSEYNREPERAQLSAEDKATILSSFKHRFVPAQDSSAPTLLLLHGTGGTEDDLLDLGRMLLPQAALLSPRGRVLENGMPRFFRRLAEGVFDQEDLHNRTHELATFIAAAGEQYHFDPARLIAVGYSNGANIAASLLLLHPSVLMGGILLRPMVPFIPEQTPDLAQKSVFIGAGRLDPIVPMAQTEQLVSLLRQAGAQVKEHWQNSGHGLTHEDVREAKIWLQNQAW